MLAVPAEALDIAFVDEGSPVTAWLLASLVPLAVLLLIIALEVSDSLV